MRGESRRKYLIEQNFRYLRGACLILNEAIERLGMIIEDHILNQLISIVPRRRGARRGIREDE